MKKLILLILLIPQFLFSQEELNNILPGEEPIYERDPETGDPIVSAFQESDSGFLMQDASLNDILQFLAKEAGRQYFHNSRISGPEYSVTGHLNEGEPIKQMDELAFMYGLTLYEKGDTVYAMTPSQMGQMPSSEWHYQLRYLRPTDIEQIKSIIRPFLSDTAGGKSSVNYETKTNTLIVIDNSKNIEKVKKFVQKIDRPKGQIIVETKILRVRSAVGKYEGVDWSSMLGREGAQTILSGSLARLFNFPVDEGLSVLTAIGEDGSAATETASSSLVLSPIQLRAVLRALREGGVTTELSNPTVITEDNEPASISIIDRVPIIITERTTTANDTIFTDDVRYKIDESDKTIADGADQTREIGITLSVTPTALPDGTIRMNMRPRTAQITENITSAGGNSYPRVTESTIEAISRVPDGHSLLIGGFYGETSSEESNKVPILGDIPGISFMFRSSQTRKEKTSLVFVITPKTYSPEKSIISDRELERAKQRIEIKPGHDFIDPNVPQRQHDPNPDSFVSKLKKPFKRSSRGNTRSVKSTKRKSYHRRKR